MRKGPQGKPKPPLTMREKVFYGIGAVGFGLALLPRVMDYFSKKQDPVVLVRRIVCYTVGWQAGGRGVCMHKRWQDMAARHAAMAA